MRCAYKHYTTSTPARWRLQVLVPFGADGGMKAFLVEHTTLVCGRHLSLAADQCCGIAAETRDAHVRLQGVGR